MRLEDWQRWLDTQFIDPATQEEPAPEPKEEPVTPADVFVPPTASTYAGTAETTQPVYVPPAVVENTVVSSPVMETDIPSSLVDEVVVPSLDRYLPFLQGFQSEAQETPSPAESQAAVPEASVVAEPADEPAVVEAPAAQESVLETPASPIETTPPAAPPTPHVAEEPAVGPVVPVVVEAAAEPKESETLEVVPVPAATVDEEVDLPNEPHILRAQRAVVNRRYGISHKRARHARNVKPADVAAQLEDGALWNLVPKHIQTLISLGSEETTQNSYKRSFKETRIDLIQRLLDPTLSLEDTARLLNVCPTTVRRYTNKGLLSHQRTTGDQRRFKLSDVLAFLEAQSRAGRRG